MVTAMSDRNYRNSAEERYVESCRDAITSYSWNKKILKELLEDNPWLKQKTVSPKEIQHYVIAEYRDLISEIDFVDRIRDKSIELFGDKKTQAIMEYFNTSLETKNYFYSYGYLRRCCKAWIIEVGYEIGALSRPEKETTCEAN